MVGKLLCKRICATLCCNCHAPELVMPKIRPGSTQVPARPGLGLEFNDGVRVSMARVRVIMVRFRVMNTFICQNSKDRHKDRHTHTATLDKHV